MKKIFFAIFVVVFAVFLGFSTRSVFSDELDDITKQINDLTTALNQSKTATAPLETQLNSIKARVSQIEIEIATKKKDIEQGYKNLEKQQKILNLAVRAYYIKSYYNSPILILLSSGEATKITQVLAYQKAAADQDKQIITSIALTINGLEQRKKDLESEQEKLAQVKLSLDKVVGEAKSYQSKLSSQIAELTAKQQQIINQRLASLNIPRSAGTSARGCTDDRGVDPGFSPRLAFFTYGAPHRNGLNQYGAKGRADAGQNVEQILQAYYPNMSLKRDYDQNAQVNVDGFGSYSIEDYTKHIFEVPESWPMETLKAQAVAARTYALNSMQRNGHICTTEACQVFHQEEKGGRWNEAVAATAGWVLMDGGGPGFTQYASTHGGYILNLGKFDGDGGNPGSFADLNSRAYDGPSHGNSPWFYCDWGSRSQYSGTAWLRTSEAADIVNVILLARKDSGTGDHLYQTDKPHPYGGEIWNEDRVRQELKNRGITPYNNASDVSVGVDFGGGTTTGVTVSGDAGSNSFGGDEFKGWFNLRAPANIQIVGPLFNVEKQ